MYTAHLPDKPLPPMPEDRKRWERIARARRLMDGGWEEDIQRELRSRLSSNKRRVWGKPTLAINLYRDIHSQIGGVLYDQPPEVSHVDSSADGLLQESGLLDRIGLWPAMQSFAEDLSACQDHALRLHWSEQDGVTVTPVYGDCVVAESRYRRPSEPVRWYELQVHIVNDYPCWVWEMFDISDPVNPRHEFVKADASAFMRQGYRDMTEQIAGQALSGDRYMYRYQDGSPFIPCVLYHVRPLSLWSSGRLVEMQSAALETSVLWTYWRHCVQTSVHAQRNVAGLRPRGVQPLDAGKADMNQYIDEDPSSVTLYDVETAEDDSAVQPMHWQWRPAVDPAVLEKAISSFCGRLSAHAGIPASDIMRTASGDAQSGYAISISNAGLRRIQRKLEPQLRRGDLQTLRKIAAVSNRAGGTAYPESGYTISYPALPKSPEELTAELEDINGKIVAGLMSRIDGLMRLHPGMSRQQAIDMARRIDDEQARYGRTFGRTEQI